MMNKLFSILSLLMLSVNCFANINGTFIQSWLYSYWNDERWEKEIALMKEVGINEIIMGDVASRNSHSEPWNCNYPSQLPNIKVSEDEITKILKKAKEGNMKLYLGLGSDSRWWNWNLCNDNDYKEFSDAMEMACSIARELHTIYQKEYSTTFAGYYSVYEIWNHIEWNDPQRRSLYAERMAEQFNRLIDTLNAIDPTMPLLFSPFATQADWCANIENTQAFYEEFFQKCHFRDMDGMLPMDNIGGGGQTIDSVEPWYTMYANAIKNSNGKPQCHANIESFVQPADSLLYDTESTPLFGINYWGSAPIGRFIKQLEFAKNYADKIYTFAYSHYQSPTNNIPWIHENLIEYLQNKTIDTTPPSLPLKVMYEMSDIVNTVNYSTQKIFKLTWSDDYYDDKGILRVNLYKDGNCIAYRTSTRNESGNIAHEPDFILYPNYSASDQTYYEIGFVDTWGNEKRSIPFNIDLNLGENNLEESTSSLVADSNNNSIENNLNFTHSTHCSLNIREEGLYEINFYSLAGTLIAHKKQWMKVGNNLIEISNHLQKRPFLIQKKYLKK